MRLIIGPSWFWTPDCGGIGGLSFKANRHLYARYQLTCRPGCRQEVETHSTNSQQLLRRTVGQQSAIGDLKCFGHPDLLVLLALSSMSSPSTGLEVSLQRGFVSSRCRQDGVLQLTAHLQTRLPECQCIKWLSLQELWNDFSLWLVVVWFKAYSLERCPVFFGKNLFPGKVTVSCWTLV